MVPHTRQRLAQAKFLSVEIDELLFRKWFTYNTIDEPLNDMIALLKKRREIV